MNSTFVLRPPYIEYFRDFSRFRSGWWVVALVASVLIHAFFVWRASIYVPRPPLEEVRVEVRMIKPEPPPPPPPPPKLIEPPPPPPPPKPVPKPPKEVVRQPPPPVLAAPPAPTPPTPSEPVVAPQPKVSELPPIDAPPPPPGPPAPAAAAPSAPAAPGPVTSSAPVSDNFDALLSGFGRELSRNFEKNKRYPRVAQMRGLQGKLELLFEFENGELVNVSVKKSSGHSALDDAAIEVARKLTLPALAGALAQRKFSFTLPVDYKLQ